MRRLLYFVILSTLLAGCNYTHLKGASNDNQRFNLPTEEKHQLSYSYVVKKVFARNCVSCHGNSGDVNLETYAQIRSNLAKIKQSVFVDHTMPKRGTLTDEEMSILWSWIDLDAPEFPKNGTEDPPPPPITATYESINTNILQVTCIKCHTAGKSAERVLLDKESLLNSPLELVLPGNAAESGLVIDLERTDDKRMPPAKEGYSPLKPDQLQAVRDWINNGAKD